MTHSQTLTANFSHIEKGRIAMSRSFALALATAVLFVTAQSADANVVAQWSFESGSELLDTAPSGAQANNLTAIGTPVYADGIPGLPGRQAVSIDSTGAGGAFRLTTPDASDLDITSTWTIEAFVNPTSLTTEWSRLILKWDGAGLNSYHLAFRNATATLPDGQRTDLFINGTTEVVAEVGPAIATGAWQHIAITNDSSDAIAGLKTYVDGVLVDSAAGVTLLNTAGGLGLGDSAGSPAPAIAYDGLLDEVLIHNMAVSEEYIEGRANLLTAPAPEPSSLILAVLAIVGLGVTRRRRRV